MHDVYPSVSGITQRGGLLERWKLAENLGCAYIEIPADFIKNKTEIEKTGLDLGCFLNERAITILYKKDYKIPQKLKYILHTEPSLTRNNGCGISYQPPLKWYDREWLEKFICMVISISKFLGIASTIIEIHPGDNRNSFEDIIMSVTSLLERYKEEFKIEPLILIENRTGQFISNEKDISSFWKFLSANNPDLKKKVGIVLDVQQLYTVTKKNFLREFEMIPIEALKGFHTHSKHRVPSLSNKIPWELVFDRISKMNDDIIVSPLKGGVKMVNKCISTNLPIFYHILHDLKTISSPLSNHYLYNQISKTF